MAEPTFPSNDPMIGEVFAEKYRIDAQLGRGGMGAVYKAHHIYLEHLVAIKLLQVDPQEGDAIFKRFLREAQVLSRLDHPNAIRVYDFGVVDRVPYLVMEFVQGKTLGDVLTAQRHLSPARCVDFLDPICSALAEAHGKGIVHRDIKPDNIMITAPDDGSPGVVKVLDFGISKVLAPEEIDVDGTNLTQANMVLGTPRYIAPEQALGRPVDQRTDLYSLAVMTYEMLNGHLPFRGTSGQILLAQHLQEDPEPFDKARKLKPALCKVVLKALSKKPEQRQQNVSEFLSEFVNAAGVGGARTASSPTPRPSGRGGSRALVAATAILVTGLGAALFLRSEAWRSFFDPSVDGTDASPTRSLTDRPPTNTAVARPGPDDARNQGPRVQDDTGSAVPANPAGSAPRQQPPGPASTETPVQRQPVAANTEVERADPEPASSPPDPTTLASAKPPGSLVELPEPPPGLYIQLERVSTLAEARRLQGTLESGGFGASVQSIRVGGEPVFEVLVGPYSSIPEAASAGARLKELALVDGPVSRMRTVF